MTRTPLGRKKIVLLAAAPADGTRLRLEQEIREIEAGLRAASLREDFQFKAVLAVRTRDLHHTLLTERPQVVHFSGHGSRRGELLVENKSGNAHPVPPDILAELFSLCSDHVECVLLNACYGEAQAEAISAHIPYVIGSSGALDDRAAIAFSIGFYGALGEGKPYEDAFRFGRNLFLLDFPHLPPPLLKEKPGGIPVQVPRKAILDSQDASLDGRSAVPIIPWRPRSELPSPTTVDVFRLLDWHSRLTPLIGRSEDLQELFHWARSKPDVLVRFLVGPGGSGKTRLALEAAEMLRNEGWNAGQIFLDRRRPALNADKGVFWVVDYPEAWRPQVQQLLQDLSRIENTSAPVRVLLLSRLFTRDWLPLIDAAVAASICDVQEIRLGPLPEPIAVDLFHAASARFAELLDRPLPPVSAKAISEWLDRDRGSNPLPLFIIAGALHSVLSESHELSLSGSEIVAALVRRERVRLDNIGRKAKWREGALSRVVALAAVAGGLDAETLRHLAAEGDLGLPAERPVDAIKSLGFWDGHGVPAPVPDIVAAEFLFEILDDAPDQASEWLWCCLIGTAPQKIDRLGHIAYDIARLRGPDDFRRFASWLAAAADGQTQRAKKWRQIFEQDRLPLGLLQLAVAIGETLLKGQIAQESERANILTILSDRLSDTGRSSAALESCREAVGIYRRLVAANPQAYEPDMARSLRSLSLCLRKESESEDALSASREAVEIWRRLTAAEPNRYEPNLAQSLHALSVCLSEQKESDSAGALEAIRTAVDIWRRLVRTNAARYEHDLALSLNTLAVDLGEIEDQEGALRTIREAVEIWRRLAETNPARFEPDLAYGLNNLSSLLRVAGDEKGSIEAIQSAIKIYGRVTAANPERYEPDLARSLDNLYLNLSDTEDPNTLVNVMREATQIQRNLAAASPTSHEPGLTQRLDRLSRDLSDPGHAVDVLQALRVARQTVTILLVRGEAPNGERIYAYVAVRADKLEAFMEAQKLGMFYPENFGVIVESGEGEPPPDVRGKMETEYGFNHDLMVDISDSEQARQIVDNLDSSATKE